MTILTVILTVRLNHYVLINCENLSSGFLLNTLMFGSCSKAHKNIA